MKVWKLTAIVSMAVSSVLSVLVCRDLLSGSSRKAVASAPSSMFPRPSSSPASSSLAGRPRRHPRDLRHRPSLIAQYSALLESYTEGELRPLIAALMERYRQSVNSGGHELPLFAQGGPRTKRAKARHKPCALQELEVTVSELGLGYAGRDRPLPLLQRDV
ncbi:hypothetical protein JRQ81_008709 [Phrynocephalus forsythii]|uniref:Uncharacterized protein n=1 Tax=Phrynocephalus forsythii TaxID=171643 RepID=A0A9Q0XCK4_9SAUR|nr:hypothetical protein JRQ81_008709 [Phrynocephalus forsythii]